MQHERWHKVKVIRSKVKVKYAIKQKNGIGCKSGQDSWILAKLIHRIDINVTLKVTQSQSHKVKGQGQIFDVKKFLDINYEWMIGS